MHESRRLIQIAEMDINIKKNLDKSNQEVNFILLKSCNGLSNYFFKTHYYLQERF